MSQHQNTGVTKQILSNADVRGQFIPIQSLDLEAPLDDVRKLDSSVVNADVIGIGVSERFAHELFVLQSRLLRWLVEEHGFRLLVLEEDWTKGIELDRWVCQGDENAVVALEGTWGAWRTNEMVHTLEWLRERNRQHPDDLVRIAGLDVTGPRPFTYDAVIAFSKSHLPRHTEEITTAYQNIQHSRDKTKVASLARRVVDLVGKEPKLELAVLHAHLIDAYHAVRAGEAVDTEALFADNVQWWMNHYRQKAVIWGGLAHTAAAPSTAWELNTLKHGYGSHLRKRLGKHYASIGLTFDHGQTLYTYPSPPNEFSESLFTNIGSGAVALDVTRVAQSHHDTLTQWVNNAATTRVIGPTFDANRNHEFSMSGASLRDWFDILIHVPTVTPASFLER